jgi:predicted amidohydrolase YtcJ
MKKTFADQVFFNGEIYTVDDKQPWAQAVAIKEDTIVQVGNNQDIQSLISDTTTVTDLKGKMMLPGFHDTHVHLISGGMLENNCILKDSKTVAEVLTGITSYLQKTNLPQNEWVHCSGLDMTLSDQISIEELDQVANGRPLYIQTSDGHSIWVNSKVLELAGITEETPEPLQGEIVRLPGTNIPSGFLHDFAAQIVKNIIPTASIEERIAGLETGMQKAHQFGITSILEPGMDDHLLAPYVKLSDENKLLLRVRASISPIYWQPGAFGDEIIDFIDTRKQYTRENIDVESVKMYIDGVLENGSAVLLEPYLKEEFNGHPPFYSQDELDNYITRLDKKGLQVHLHAIGDGGVRMALDAFTAAREANGTTDNRHTICHLQMIDPLDVPRFAELGVCSSFQPLWARVDEWVTDLNIPLVGENRVKKFYVINSINQVGGIVAGGSDWFVSSLNPLEAIETGIRRQDPYLPNDSPTLNQEEAVDIETMIAAYTINGAFLMHQEEKTGSIEVGKKADLIILDQNICKIPSSEIHQSKVLKTIFGGKVVYERSQTLTVFTD